LTEEGGCTKIWREKKRLQDRARGLKMQKKAMNRRKGKKLVQKPLPAVLNLSKRGLNQPDLVKVIAALHKEHD
jgi:hypothetical protein